jgi:hypothetical protein
MKAMVEATAIPTSMTVFDGFATTATRPVPDAYLMQPNPGGLHRSVARILKAHGVEVEETVGTSRVAVDRFVIEGVNRAERAFQGHRETSITGRFAAPWTCLLAHSSCPRRRRSDVWCSICWNQSVTMG